MCVGVSLCDRGSPQMPDRTNGLDTGHSGPDRLRNRTSEHSREFLWALRYSALLLFSTALFAVPAVAQLGSPEEASGLEGVGILQSFVYLLIFVVPIIAVIIVLTAFAVLMSTRDPQKKSEWKKVRNQAILYGLIITPSLGVIIGLLGSLTGNPVLADLGI